MSVYDPRINIFSLANYARFRAKDLSELVKKGARIDPQVTEKLHNVLVELCDEIDAVDIVLNQKCEETQNEKID